MSHELELFGMLSATAIWGGIAVTVLLPYIRRQFAVVSLHAKRTPFRAILGAVAVGVAIAYGGSKPSPEPTQVRVTFDANGGECGEASRQVTKGEPVGELPAATREGYDFAGWFTSAEGGDEVTAATVVEADTTVFAQWTAVEYAIGYELGGGVNAEGNPTSYTVESGRIELAPATRAGHEFTGWTPDGGVIAAGSTGDRTFTAGWREVAPGKQVVTFDANGGECGEASRQVTKGEPVGELPAATREGYDFAGWFTSAEGGDEVTAATVVEADTTVFAQWMSVALVGRYRKLYLVDELGVEIPDDVDYAKGDKVTVKVEGLAKGLKLAQDKTSKAWIVSGVPTDEIDFERNPMYARVTVTYKDKTKGEKGKVESLQPVVLSIVTPEPTVLTAGVLNEAYEPADIAELWPAVADAKDNPKEWSFKGWPLGIKYTTKDVTKKNKDKSVTTVASACSVYGTPTKAGEFAITATHKHKLADGKTTVSETFSAVLTVWGDDGATDFRYTDQAYGAAVDATIADAKSVSGLPTGLKFDKATGKVTGTPTKPGVFAVAVTKSDKTKETFLWKVEPGENGGVLGEIGWEVADSAVTVMQGVVQGWPVAMPDGAKVTASGLPAGLKLVQDKRTRAWTISGTPTKAGNFVVTFKTVRNGVTITERISIIVTANEWTGKWYGVQSGDADASLLGEVMVSANGTVKLVYTEGSTNTNAKGIVQSAVRKTTVTVKNLDANGTTATLVLPKDKKDPLSADRMCVLDFENCVLKIGGTARMHLGEVDAGWVSHDVTTVVMEEVLGGETNAYGYVTATYKSGKFTLAGKLWDGTAVKGTAYPLGLGESFSPVMVTDKAKNSVTITLGGTGGDAVVLVRENGRALSIGSSGTVPWSAGFEAAELKSKKFNQMSDATGLVVLTDAGEQALTLADKDLKASVSAQGLVKFTITDEDGRKWVSELLPVDNGGETQFRGIATGTKSRQPTQVCPVRAE